MNPIPLALLLAGAPMVVSGRAGRPRPAIIVGGATDHRRLAPLRRVGGGRQPASSFSVGERRPKGRREALNDPAPPRRASRPHAALTRRKPPWNRRKSRHRGASQSTAVFFTGGDQPGSLDVLADPELLAVVGAIRGGVPLADEPAPP
jgi:hypothetical protein